MNGNTGYQSFFYIMPDVNIMIVGDTLIMEAMVTPSNAFDMGYTFEVSGDSNSVDFDPASGLLTAVQAGQIQLTAISENDASITFTRDIEVKERLVTSITIHPSETEMMVGDTLQISVEVLPEDATVREYYYEVIDTASVIEFDSISGMVVAVNAGSAQLFARWVNGEVSGNLDITVSDDTHVWNGGAEPKLTLYPNPNDGILHVKCDMQIPIEMRILDLNGRLIFEKQYTGKTVIDTTFLAPGTYLIVHSFHDIILRDKLIMLN